MPALDFPNNPTVNQQFVGSNGVTYIWDGTKWSVLTGSGGGGGGLTVPGGPMVGANGSALGSITVGSNLSLAGAFPNQTLSATGGGGGGGLPLTGGTLYNPGNSDPLTIQADGNTNNTFARIKFTALNTAPASPYAWSAGATPGSHFEIRDETLGTNPLTIWGGAASDPNTGNVYINNNDLLINHTVANQFALIHFNVVPTNPAAGTTYSWGLGATPGTHLEIRDETLGTNPVTIYGGAPGDPNSGNVFINQGGLLIGNPNENINLHPTAGTLTVNENSGTTLPPYPAGGTTAVRIIGEDGQAVRALFDCFGGGAPNFLFRHAGGTADALTPVQQGWNIGVIAFLGCSQPGSFDGLPAGWFSCVATENWGTAGANAGSQFKFGLVAPGQPASTFHDVVYFNGDGTCLNTFGNWGTLSDPRVKTIEGPYLNGLDAILALNPIAFQYNGKTGLAPDDHITRYGLDAEAVKDVMPEMVRSMKGKIDETETDILTIDNSPLIYTLVNAVKELAGRLAIVEQSPKRHD